MRLVPILDLDTDNQMKIREIRNDPLVRSAMFTDHVIGVNEHLRWISNLKSDPATILFAIFGNEPVGVIGVTGLDRVNKRGNWSLYMAPDRRGSGIGTAAAKSFLKFAFETLRVEKISCEVLENNDETIGFYERLGFELEGFRRSEIDRGERRLGVHVLGLSKPTWEQGRSELGARDSVTIEIQAPQLDHAASPIDQIEAARARNNVNWMNILRIAVEKSPVHAKQIVAEIKEIDQQISALTEQITIDP